MAQRLMELDAEGRCGAGYDEKNPERLNSRNGYRGRLWETQAESVELKIPKLRQEAYVQGISTRSVDDLVKALGMIGASKSQVSRLCGELDERVGALLCHWPLNTPQIGPLKFPQFDPSRTAGLQPGCARLPTRAWAPWSVACGGFGGRFIGVDDDLGPS